MQVYRELRILSARPTVEEEAGIPHHLFGHVSVVEPYSVARWLDDVRALLPVIHARGRTAIICGGTGLYFRALEQGLAPAPSSSPEGRDAARHLRDEMGAEAFHTELVKRDPASAALAPGDTQRVLRAWDVIQQSGRGLSDWHSETALPVVEPKHTARFVLELDRAALNARIDARFDAMMMAGALDEARAFWALQPPADGPAAKALGLPQLRSVLECTIPQEAAVAAAKTQTRRYAKRQGTWFRHQTSGWTRLDATVLAALEGVMLTNLRSNATVSARV
jgi:tRNA dimethylallyltransferase